MNPCRRFVLVNSLPHVGMEYEEDSETDLDSKSSEIDVVNSDGDEKIVENAPEALLQKLLSRELEIPDFVQNLKNSSQTEAIKLMCEMLEEVVPQLILYDKQAEYHEWKFNEILKNNIPKNRRLYQKMMKTIEKSAKTSDFGLDFDASAFFADIDSPRIEISEKIAILSGLDKNQGLQMMRVMLEEIQKQRILNSEAQNSKNGDDEEPEAKRARLEQEEAPEVVFNADDDDKENSGNSEDVIDAVTTFNASILNPNAEEIADLMRNQMLNIERHLKSMFCENRELRATIEEMKKSSNSNVI